MATRRYMSLGNIDVQIECDNAEYRTGRYQVESISVNVHACETANIQGEVRNVDL